MSEPTIAGFFQGGGVKTAKFPKEGSSVEGIITTVYPPELQRDYDTQLPLPGKYQVRIELDTEEREDGEDDGKRMLYVKGWMTGAVADALRKAGADGPQPGGKLKVTWSHTDPPTRPGLNGLHKYTAVYSPAGNFFAGNGSTPAPAATETANAPIPEQAPVGIDPQAWKVMPQEARQAIANANVPF